MDFPVRSKTELRKAFTLIELLVVIAIIATLAVVVFVALNPAQRFMDARNARRLTDVGTILNAVHTYVVDNGGTYPASLPQDGNTYQLGSCAAPNGSVLCPAAQAACVDLSTDLASHLASIPQDPSVGSAVTTAYSISYTSGIIRVAACGAEDGQIIEASR